MGCLKYMSFFKIVKDYYPTYLEAHRNKWNRRLHVLGQFMTILFVCLCFIMGLHHYLFFSLLIFAPFIVYFFAWSGHLFFENNRPATWNTNPLVTKACDWIMLWDILRGKIPF